MKAKLVSTDYDIEWFVSQTPIAYLDALSAMEARISAMIAGTEREAVWCLEHPPLYSCGTSASPDELLDVQFPVYRTGRGGRTTYHGPGQRVVYVMIDLAKRKLGVREFVRWLEGWVIDLLAAFGVSAMRCDGRVGLWVKRAEQHGQAEAGDRGEDKIAAIGIRLRKWISWHGFAVNLDLDLAPFDAIIPCGIQPGRYGLTSLARLGRSVSYTQFDQALRKSFPGQVHHGNS